jgi:hypothetical protein
MPDTVSFSLTRINRFYMQMRQPRRLCVQAKACAAKTTALVPQISTQRDSCNRSSLPQHGKRVNRCTEDVNGVATLVVLVMPLSQLSAEYSPYGSSLIVGLVIFDCKRWNSDRVKVFSELFALTSAETRVLSQLLSEGSVSHAARQLDIAQSTVQTHLKRIWKRRVPTAWQSLPACSTK